MSYSIAPAAKAILTQADALWPNRRDTSDGLLGDQAHAERRSWHNPSLPDGTPDPDGVVYAADLSHDPANGCDAHAWARRVAGHDPRVMEAISNGQIWTKRRAAEGWRTYTGESPHTQHAHITVDPAYADDTSPWFEEIDMTKDECEAVIRKVLAEATAEGFSSWAQTVKATLMGIRKGNALAQAEHDNTQQEIGEAQVQITRLQGDLTALRSELAALRAELATSGGPGASPQVIAVAVADELATRVQALATRVQA